MKIKLFKSLSAVLLIIVLGTSLSLSVGSADTSSYIITNPYETVDWDTWQAYKTQLHCHTNASDGDMQLNEVIELHYSLDYDIVAITDHATVGKPWTEAPDTVPLFRLVKYERTKMAKIIPLTEERYEEIKSGVGRGGRGMLAVEKGIELNGAVPSNSHLTGYFADYGQGLIGVDGDYETPVRENGEAGGITMLSHLGNYYEYYEKLYTDMENDERLINKFSNIFLTYPTCVGMDISSGTDSHTFRDRKLYDNILQRTIPNGVTPWCFTFSDAHQAGQYDRAFTIHMMSELTNNDLRRSMEDGTLFAVSRHARTELGHDFVGEGDYPIVTRVEIDENNDTIKLSAKNHDNIVWVANGVEIASGDTINLNDYEGQITCYVRAYLTGSGGICYVEPFAVLKKGTEYEPVEVLDEYGIEDFLRELVTVVDELIFKNNLFIQLFKYFALGVK